jgi:hypothetical protein
MIRLHRVLGIFLMVTSLFVQGSCLENPYISINPVGGHEAGETFTINGTTNLPAGTILVIEIDPVRLHPGPSHEPPQNTTALTGKTITEDNPGGKTTWSFRVNSTSLLPDYYTLRVTSFDSPVIDGSDDFTLTPPEKDRPGISVVPTRGYPDPAGAPGISGVLIVLALTGGYMIYGLRRRGD